jgi:hypothetical protein
MGNIIKLFYDYGRIQGYNLIADDHVSNQSSKASQNEVDLRIFILLP